MTDTASGGKDLLFRPAHFVEAILNQDYPVVKQARQLVLLRLQAASATGFRKESLLQEAASFAETYRRGNWMDAFNWKQVLRCHFELAEFYFDSGKSKECAQELAVVIGILRKSYTGPSKPIADLHRARALCLRNISCELGARREEAMARAMNPQL